ncbi:glycosyltransferase [Candidatus Woesebacteria bacterium]|nr:glycosyltransferase [Candidatus Woesebacteria bacterium]
MANQPKNVFMIGWEYPPHNSGGLGVACEGLTTALAQENTNIHFSLPYQMADSVDHMTVHTCVHENWEKRNCNCSQSGVQCTHFLYEPPFLAYTADFIVPQQTASQSTATNENSGYSFDLGKLRKLSSNQLEKEVTEYAEMVSAVAETKKAEFEVIHAHDWMAFPAGQELRKQTGKPLITHVHSTEYDRSGLSEGNKYITAIEHAGLSQADHVIAVSHYTKRLLEQRYGVDPNKISVVHNGISDLSQPADPGTHHFAPARPVVVFMGRLTIQKGTTYFLDLARAVLQKIPEALFVIAGHGDMYHELLLKTAHDGLSASVVFSGFVRDEQRRKLLDRADVFVMPSISEPFGLVALEAAQRHTPVIVSKNAGVSEVLPHAIALDFWDIEKMAEAIVGLVTNTEKSQLQTKGQLSDLSKRTWISSALQVREVYKKALLGFRK